MAKVTILGQTHDKVGKLFVRGVFTQKKKLWEAMAGATSIPLTDFTLIDDMNQTELAASYEGLCRKLAKSGRATLAKSDKSRMFLVVECTLNELREFDIDDAGELKFNPAKKEDGD